MSRAAAESAEQALDVFFGADRVGRLAFDPAQDRFRFAYSASWRQLGHRFPLSPHIPLDGEASAVAVRRFIDNLLPEGRALDVVSNFAHVSKSNLYGLIRVLGRETAGALSFLPTGQLPLVQEPQRRRVTLAALQQRIDARNRIPFAVWDDKVRMSLAGYQDKLLVLREGDALFLADGSLSSTHILKPEPVSDKLPCMVANEHFCMRLVIGWPNDASEKTGPPGWKFCGRRRRCCASSASTGYAMAPACTGCMSSMAARR